MHERLPVIDLFAGPGGLGEGFACFQAGDYSPFRIALSVEKDHWAHKTLLLRAFLRNARMPAVRNQYRRFIRSKRGPDELMKLFDCAPKAARSARAEALHGEIGCGMFSDDRLAEQVRRVVGSAKIWVLVGGPPCQAYSLAGRSRHAKLRKNNIAQFESDRRHYLYEHYLRLIQNTRPPVFLMENVKGLLSSTLRGERVFNRIVDDLRSPGKQEYTIYSVTKPSCTGAPGTRPDFRPSDFIVRSERYGIPQKRHRVIILGIRSDIGVVPRYLTERPTRISLHDVISDLPMIRSSVSRNNGLRPWIDCVRETADLVGAKGAPRGLLHMIHSELRRLSDKLPTGALAMPYRPGRPPRHSRLWYRIRRLPFVANHEGRSHMQTDLQRYFFLSCAAKWYSNQGEHRSPQLSDLPKRLWPKHRNVINGETKVFLDRFRVQLADQPATTVTSHIAKDGHYFIHPDPVQCRSLTVREAARVQTFPDDYVFMGPRTSQYQQVGNAVPPLLGREIAAIIYDLFQDAYSTTARP